MIIQTRKKDELKIIAVRFKWSPLMLSSEISILSANCQGLRDVNKCTDVLNYLQNLN